MKANEKTWRKPVYRRLVISFVCILLPLYILSIVIYNWGIRTLRGNISSTKTNQVSFYLEGLEKDVQRIHKLQFDCLNDTNLKQLASIHDSLTDMEKLRALLNLRQRVSAIENSSEYIKEVTILIPAIDNTITSNGPIPLDRSQFDKITTAYLEKGVQIVNDDSGMFLYAANSLGYGNNLRSPQFIVSVELSRERIEEALSSMVIGNDEEIIFYNPKSKVKIAVNDNPIFDQDMQSRITGPKILKIKGSETVKIDGKKYLAIYSTSELLGSALCEYVPENTVFAPLKKFRGWFVVLTAVALMIIVIYSYYLHEYINKPLSMLAKSFKKIEKGDLDIKIDNKNDNEFGYIYKRFNAMVEHLNYLINEVFKQKIQMQKQEILVQKAEMKQLQSQINPHFLYNSFFTLKAMSQIGDYDNLETFTEQLGEYFQFVTRTASDEVTLEKEVNHARIYTEIQARRFTKRIKVEFAELPEEFSRLMVPRLILQPIIENAFGHGLDGKHTDGLLSVEFTGTRDELKIIVEDNGSELSEDILNRLKNLAGENTEDVEVTGILNIHRRIQIMFGDQSGLSFQRGALGGLKVTISIKLKGEEDNV